MLFRSEVVAALKVPDIRSKSEEFGMVLGGSTPEDFAAALKRNLDHAAGMVKTAGVQRE